MLAFEWTKHPLLCVGYCDAPLEEAEKESQSCAISHAQHSTLTKGLSASMHAEDLRRSDTEAH